MVDRDVYIIKGWKVKGRKLVTKLEDELYNINEDWLNDLDGFYLYDGMCGEYAYFGANLGKIDVKHSDSDDIVINEKLLYIANEKWNKFLEKYPNYKEIFEKYNNDEPPQLMVVLHVH